LPSSAAHDGAAPPAASATAPDDIPAAIAITLTSSLPVPTDTIAWDRAPKAS